MVTLLYSLFCNIILVTADLPLLSESFLNKNLPKLSYPLFYHPLSCPSYKHHNSCHSLSMEYKAHRTLKLHDKPKADEYPFAAFVYALDFHPNGSTQVLIPTNFQWQLCQLIFKNGRIFQPL